MLTHRFSYKLKTGEYPPDPLMVLHSCGNRACCNPRHLYAGTHAQNTLDAVRHGTFRGGFQPGPAHPKWKGGVSPEYQRKVAGL